MCTALSLNNKKTFLFGRNMDIETPFKQNITIVPRRYNFNFKFNSIKKQDNAIIGMSCVVEDNRKKYPLFAEAANEWGLAIAGLNFPINAYYQNPSNITSDENVIKLAPYEVIPFFLKQFETTSEVQEYLKKHNVVIVDEKLNDRIPLSPLHFIVCDKNDDSIVLEPVKEGLKVYENKLGILTNNPTFDWQITNLSFYQNLTTKQSNDIEWYDVKLQPFGQGFGSFGMPGDWTPPSRFVKTAYLKSTTPFEKDKDKLISQFFHILDNVAMVKGSIIVEHKNYEMFDITLYSSCIDLNDLAYYYKTYNNNQITKISLFNENLDDDQIVIFPFIDEQKYNKINE